MLRRKLVYIFALLFIFCSCGKIPASYTGINIGANSAAHIRPMDTRTYTGNRGAIIFSVSQMEGQAQKLITDRIIRAFAEYEVPVDIAISVPHNDKEQQSMSFLVPFVDAGLVDINLDGLDISWLDADTPNGDNAFTVLHTQLSSDISYIKQNYGSPPVTCFFPYEKFNEHNYALLQETGFSIVSARESGNFSPSRHPVTWAGQIDTRGLYRLPVIATVKYTGTIQPAETATAKTPDENALILNSIDKNIKGFGVAVVSIQPGSFLGNDGRADAGMIQRLSELIKESRNHGEIVTFNGWSRYASKYIGVTQVKSRILPHYNGGPAVIFRLDDVTKDWYEDTVKALIELYKSNGVPLDCGVISNANETDSYDLPWLKKYYDEGSVGISVHGFDWTYYQLDTTKSNLTYEQIKFKLQKARDLYLNYYGANPVAITAPTDYYDKNGYQAIEESGFKIFSTQSDVEPHPSNVPVDFYGRKDPAGMYRLPTAIDVCDWDQKNERFTDPWDISKVVATKDYCKYYNALSTTMTNEIFGYEVCREIGLLNVAVLGVHPTAFVDKDGKTDLAKLQKLDVIIKWCKTNGTVTTFEQWYNYTDAHK